MLRENKDKWGKGTKLSRKMFPVCTYDQARLLHEQTPSTPCPWPLKETLKFGVQSTYVNGVSLIIAQAT